ncbi:MAG: Holliday junction resolvase RuvX [Alistipes sp.]|nr:Holliday junction resolvase RuvX [Candidatus Alistipes equi]
MGRIIAIDFGKVRTGLAVTDPLRIIASPLVTVETKHLEKFLEEYFSKEDVDTIVIGKASRMNGTPSETMRYIEPLLGRLRHCYPQKKVLLFDERFTSVMAKHAIHLSELSRSAKQDKALVDKVAAAIILQSYMESVNY